MINILKKNYKKIWSLIKSEKPNLSARLTGQFPDTRPWPEDTRSEVLQLVKNLPHPDSVSEEEILSVLNEIYMGKLEWAFRLPYEGKYLGVAARDLIRDNISTP